jgi:hypothetical protein
VTAKELLDEYFQGLAKKFGWKHLIVDGFRFLGSGSMTESPVLGKTGFVQMMTHFYKLLALRAFKTRFR